LANSSPVNSWQCQTTRQYWFSRPEMLSQIQLSSDTTEVHSIRQPWVEMSMTRALTRLLLPSRIMALRRSAVRSARRRSGWISAALAMRVCSRAKCAAG
jgi:hypothetical protein